MKCACGCGGDIIDQPYHKYKGTPKYIRGHYPIKEFIEQQQKSQKGEDNPMYGKSNRLGMKHTEETKQKMREAQLGKKSPMLGKKHTDASKLKMSESLKGENSPNWKGGISFEPYCPKFNNIFKEEIREMFDRKCFMCEISENETGQKHCVHHVTYDKSCLCDDKVCKFVPLCRSCHAKTNHNRDCWEKHIIDKLNKLQGEI